MLVIGVNSGTSVDSIDVAICQVSDDDEHENTTQISEHIMPIPRMKLMAFGSVPWEPHLRQRIFDLMTSQHLSSKDFCEMNVLIGDAFKSAIENVLLENTIDPKTIQVVGSHGQTIYHQVESNQQLAASQVKSTTHAATTHSEMTFQREVSSPLIKSTLQLGDPSRIARLGIPVISNFRTNDVALGGEGAPLTSIFDFLLLRHSTKWRAIQNIGGIGNVTFVPPLTINDKDASSLVVSFDTGPGNALIDDCVRLVTNGQLQMDVDGKMASAGVRNESLFESLCEFYRPYFEMPYPKTTGRELFGKEQVQQWIEKTTAHWKQMHHDQQSNDINQHHYGNMIHESSVSEEEFFSNSLVTTFTDLTAYSITRAYSLVVSKLNLTHMIYDLEVVVSGGGQHNPYLMKRLYEMLSQEFGRTIHILSHEQLERQALNSNAKEAMLFALLAYLHERGRVANIPSVTGALRACLLGSKTPAL
ncbi:hypothetical protein FDP41_010556 [Naegleria fowleri]|uniref:Anhydro-N-acetylmuramic acid kinase n=1 Tax=Naegleria fowleri TaxID=5763 RepID=A0A6A5C8L7_NAEFO|nr:uncharacterized protein FDP41_010556 [Naegleria fowleri]KAF0983491.1 hypothetical protein FDP41_010556 [Naegleria fowleri]